MTAPRTNTDYARTRFGRRPETGRPASFVAVPVLRAHDLLPRTPLPQRTPQFRTQAPDVLTRLLRGGTRLAAARAGVSWRAQTDAKSKMRTNLPNSFRGGCQWVDRPAPGNGRWRLPSQPPSCQPRLRRCPGRQSGAGGQAIGQPEGVAFERFCAPARCRDRRTSGPVGRRRACPARANTCEQMCGPLYSLLPVNPAFISTPAATSPSNQEAAQSPRSSVPET